MKPRPKKVDEGGDEDWLVTFSDTISLLLAFFVMLVSFSKIDIPTFEKVQAGIKKEIGKQDQPQQPIFTLFNNLNAVLDGAPIEREAVQVGFDDQGIVIEFASGSFFKPGSAELLDAAKTTLDGISDEMTLPAYELYFIEVEGHTDDTPIATAMFPSNWELSAGRASTVVRYFIGKSLVPERLKASGYADIRPKLPNRDITGTPIPENQAANRRIVIRLHP
ncbi:MAG: flagellar motor protein MotB [Alphaproteobacteria bacterium]